MSLVLVLVGVGMLLGLTGIVVGSLTQRDPLLVAGWTAVLLSVLAFAVLTALATHQARQL